MTTHIFQMGGEKPPTRILMQHVMGNFEGFPFIIAHCLGWFHIMTPVLPTLTLGFGYREKNTHAKAEVNTLILSFNRLVNLGVPKLGIF